MTQTNQNEVVIEVTGPNQQYAEETFRNAFPEERDHLLPRIPEIRRQMERWEIYHEEETDPPGYLRITRAEAADLAELLNIIGTGQIGGYEATEIADQIRAQLDDAGDEVDPDVRTLRGRRFGWTEPADSRPATLLVAVSNVAELRHPKRFQSARIGAAGANEPIYQIKTTKAQRAAVKASAGILREEFHVRIAPDGTLALLDATPQDTEATA